MLLCAVDLTERQHLQNELILAHKARAIEALAGGIAHSGTLVKHPLDVNVVL